MTDLAGKIGDEINKELSDLKKKHAKLNEDRQALEHEKTTMGALNAKASDVLEINVGGRMFTTKRATLTLAEGSLLAGMFSGRWEGSLDLDRGGNIFLDFDPDCFEKVLYQLRLSQISGKKTNWVQVPAPEGKSKYFHELLEFFTLVHHTGFIASFAKLDSLVLSLEDGSKVRKTTNSSHAFALGTMVLERGTYTWGINMTNVSASASNWIYAGVISSAVQPQSSSFSDPTSFGWANNGQVHLRGKAAIGRGGWQGFLQDDRVKMQIDVDARVLRMKLDRLPGSVFTINDLDQGPWCVHVNLHGLGDEVQLTQADEF